VQSWPLLLSALPSHLWRPAITGRFPAVDLRTSGTLRPELLVGEAGGSMTTFDGSPFRLDSREVLATNGLLRDELLGFFGEMFAGHALEPIPTPAEFAARRAQRTKS